MVDYTGTRSRISPLPALTLAAPVALRGMRVLSINIGSHSGSVQRGELPLNASVVGKSAFGREISLSNSRFAQVIRASARSFPGYAIPSQSQPRLVDRIRSPPGIASGHL